MNEIRYPASRWPRWLAALLWIPMAVLADDSGIGHPGFLSPHAAPIAVHGQRVYAVNTPADTLDVIDAESRSVIARIPVGIDPVSVAVRPDGRELWVSNHVSDSVSVIDIDPDSPSHHQIIATIQDLDPVTRATRFDEPVGIAFANNDKAYVALSSENRIAVIDVASHRLQSSLTIQAQDPRALVVRNGRLYVIPFESNNQTQISGCVGSLNSDLCTFDAVEHVVDNNNVLSLFIDVDIVRHPLVPDRDLFVFDTETDRLLEIVDGLGTLLYGIAVDSQGRVFVAQTEARNDANGRAGTLGEGLAEMDNRAFLNQISRIDCSGPRCGLPQWFQLEPMPPANPAPGMALATPFAIQVSDDDRTLVVSAASSNRVFTVDAQSGQVLGRVTVGSVPRGIALVSDGQGQPAQAWVLNAVSDSVSLLDVSNPASPTLVDTVALEDPTHPEVKRGRMAFNDAMASTNETFSCESCHPDGGTDQLAWILDTPICDVPGCTQIPPRITMPIRGLRDTWPYHWDGIPGDPYGGRNTANINGIDPPNCNDEQPETCTRNLVDGGLATTMCATGACPSNGEGQAGALSGAERHDMSRFLLSVPYPPAQRRGYDNVLSDTARNGFRLFHIEGDLQETGPNVCGNCHRMPFWVSTNTPGTGMEAPTWRGAWDRWVILPQGRLNIIDFPFFRPIIQSGANERNVWRLSWGGRGRFDPVWNMVVEGSTGFSGSFARQVTLSADTADEPQTRDLLDALERSAEEGGIVLTLDGVLLASTTPVSLRFDDGLYASTTTGPSYSRGQLMAMARNGGFIGTATGRLGENVDLDHPQPALWSAGPMHIQRGPQQFPTLSGDTTLRISGRHIETGAHVVVDGRRVAGNVRCTSGELPDCADEAIEVELAALPASAGMHFLQVQNRRGLFSNDYIFNTTVAGGAVDDDVSGPWYDPGQDGHGWFLERIGGADGSSLLNAYWYVYSDGLPVWLIGLGELHAGIAELDVFITAGGQFPPAFDPESVTLTPWGTLTLEFASRSTGSASWQSDLEGFGSGSLNIRRLGNVDGTDAACASGSYYNPEQDGHGFVAQVLDVESGPELLLSWYVYRDGQPIWLLGQAPLIDGQASVPMGEFSGADFPPAFESEAVNRSDWGTLTFRFTGPNAARADWNSDIDGNGGTDLVRLTRLDGLDCP